MFTRYAKVKFWLEKFWKDFCFALFKYETIIDKFNKIKKINFIFNYFILIKNNIILIILILIRKRFVFGNIDFITSSSNSKLFIERNGEDDRKNIIPTKVRNESLQQTMERQRNGRVKTWKMITNCEFVHTFSNTAIFICVVLKTLHSFIPGRIVKVVLIISDLGHR